MEMISRLRRKFIALGTAAVVLIIVVVLGTLNLVSFYDEGSNMDAVLRYITRHGGVLPERGSIHDEGFEYTPEFLYQTRYYWGVFSAEGTLDTVNTSHIAAVSMEEAADRMTKILASRRMRGNYEAEGAYYAYLVTPLEDGNSFVVVMDCTKEMQMVWNGLRFSGFIGVFCILLYVALVAYFSRRLIEPFVRNLRSQRQFITNAGHELRTPIAIISANTEVLEITTGRNQWTETILKQVKRLSGLVNDMVSLAKLEERVSENFHPIDVNCSETAREVVESFSQPAKEQGKSLTADIAEDVHVLADQRILYTLFNVFVDNAVKYCDDGGTVRVVLRPGKKGRGLIFAVTNPYEAGAGVDYSRFFERFYRADASHSSEKAGYGIGLTIAAEIVRYLSGKIGVSYKDGAITFRAMLK